ncbi:MAG: hypothetical protein ACPGQL_07795 [Thermoplasmatota archaeon]
MTDLVRLAYYPFLPGVQQAVREYGPDLEELLTAPAWRSARRRALDRVEGTLRHQQIPPAVAADEASALQELLSVGIAKMAAVVLKDRTLAKRWADAEAAKVSGHLQDELRQGSTESLEDAIEALEVPLRPIGDGQWRIHVTDYLRHAPQETEWKLVLKPVAKGHIDVSSADAAVLCREAYARRTWTELEAELKRPPPADLVRWLAPVATSLEPLLAEARQHWGGDFGPVRTELFPPCITDLFHQMAGGSIVAHHGRFAFASFLSTIGMTAEGIMDYLSTIPNFDRSKSEYQIKHIAGDLGVEAYTPPGCSWMQTNGVCPLDQRDDLCARIKHPLSYYRAQTRRRDKDEAEAAKLIAAKKAKDSMGGAGA